MLEKGSAVRQFVFGLKMQCASSLTIRIITPRYRRFSIAQCCNLGQPIASPLNFAQQRLLL